MATEFEKRYGKIKEKYLQGIHLQEREQLLKQIMSRPVALYGVGYFKAAIVRNLQYYGVEIECFCDSFKTGIDSDTNLPIFSLEEFKLKYPQANVLITAASENATKAITENLLQNGYGREQIYGFNDFYKLFRTSATIVSSYEIEEFERHYDGYAWAYEFFGDNRSKQIIMEKIECYLFQDTVSFEPVSEAFFMPEIVLGTDEVFVDAGTFTGGTTKRFVEKVNGVYRAIHCFELDPKNQITTKENLSSMANITFEEKGLSSFTGIDRAELRGNGGSRIIQSGMSDASVTSLDDMFLRVKEDFPTYIVMDIEGSERDALRGAKQLICKRKPRLAVCAYYVPEYIYELPKMIHDLNPGYKFALRQYSPYLWDTVLYAY